MSKSEIPQSAPIPPPPPPPLPQPQPQPRLQPPPRLRPLHKQHSWSPDMLREEAWERRKGNYRTSRRLGRAKSSSVSDEDLEELKACFELGFGFDSPDIDPKLSDTIPALGFYQAINKQYHNSLSRSSSVSSSLSLVSDNDINHDETTSPIYDPSDDPKTVKTKLRQWAQVVACLVQQPPPSQ